MWNIESEAVSPRGARRRWRRHSRSSIRQTAAIADSAKPADLVRPGHVFPLRAQPGGVLARRGHTEGSVDLARLAGLKPAAVLCELTTRTGEMLRGRRAEAYARRNGFPVLSIAELVRWRIGEAGKAA